MKEYTYKIIIWGQQKVDKLITNWYDDASVEEDEIKVVGTRKIK